MKKRKVFLQAEEARIKSLIQHIDRCEARLQKVVARCYDRERPTDQWSEEKKGDKRIFFSWLRKIFVDGTNVKCEFMERSGNIYVYFPLIKDIIFDLCPTNSDIIGIWPTYTKTSLEFIDFHTKVLGPASLELITSFCKHANEHDRKRKYLETIRDGIPFSTQARGDMTDEQFALAFLICNICHVTELANSSVFVRDIVRRIKGHGLH